MMSQAAHDAWTERLHTDVFKMLEFWRKKAASAEQVNSHAFALNLPVYYLRIELIDLVYLRSCFC